MHNKLIKIFQRDFLFLWLVSLLINIITWAIVYFKIKPDSEIVPLHYNIFYGIDIAGKGYFIYLVPAIGLSVLVVNYWLFSYALGKDRFAANTTMAITLFVQIIIFAAVLFLKSIIVI